jgi:hypothetical protein
VEEDVVEEVEQKEEDEEEKEKEKVGGVGRNNR